MVAERENLVYRIDCAPPRALRLHRRGLRTKAELAAHTGLARSTVSSRVDVLLAAGLVQPAGEAAE